MEKVDILGLDQDSIGNQVIASPGDVITVLTRLQTNALDDIDLENEEAGYITSYNLRRKLAHSLVECGEFDEVPVLSELTEDMIELISVLFENILKVDEMQASVRKQILRMQLPTLKVALMDSRFLDNAKHPLRKFLDALAEIGTRWMEDLEYDRTLVPSIVDLVERALADFRDNPAVFEKLETEAQVLLKKAQRKFEANQQRTREAFQGKERLYLAQKEANDFVTGLVQDRVLPKFAERFIKGAWRNYLALVLTRNASDSEAWAAAQALTADLVDSLDSGQEDERKDELQEQVGSIRRDLRQALTQVGLFESDAKAVVSELSFLQGWALVSEKGARVPATFNDPSKGSHAGEKELAAAEHFGDTIDSSQHDLRTLESDEDKALAEKISRLPLGTWIDYQQEIGKEPEHCRLAWYSPATQRCLLVSRSGRMSDSKSLAEMVHDIQARKAVIRRDEPSHFMTDMLYQVKEIFKIRGQKHQNQKDKSSS